MNIYAKRGDMVVFTGEGGYEYEREAAKTMMDVGEVYIVDRTEVSGWRTDVYLRGVPGKWNSALFEDAM